MAHQELILSHEVELWGESSHAAFAESWGAEQGVGVQTWWHSPTMTHQTSYTYAISVYNLLAI